MNPSTSLRRQVGEGGEAVSDVSEVPGSTVACLLLALCNLPLVHTITQYNLNETYRLLRIIIFKV